MNIFKEVLLLEVLYHRIPGKICKNESNAIRNDIAGHKLLKYSRSSAQFM